MGNTMAAMATGGRKKAKVIKITGEALKLKTPISSSDLLKDYPGYVLLESESVKKLGIRAKPLEPNEDLKPKKIYFLLELPKLPEPEENVPRRARSAVHMSAKDRLECLMLSRRSSSDVSSSSTSPAAPVQVKMRLRRSEVEKLIQESKDETELAERIVGLCMQNPPPPPKE
ncbi:hypothetical protein M9H77_05585 [Catharanthus roseus]|uniref:Uncharacterized protein n=1 Tax=Catharanthus roseus TaxID=4058 RepID=A0ACC0CHP5_CATRO|nr:hypothetical protein M9H77_05585 [Catharanthus roseus]